MICTNFLEIPFRQSFNEYPLEQPPISQYKNSILSFSEEILAPYFIYQFT